MRFKLVKKSVVVKAFFRKKNTYFFCMNLLVMPKYWGKQMFTHGRFPEVGQKQKTEKKEKAKVGNNNGHLCISTPPRVAHAKPPGPIPDQHSTSFALIGILVIITFF